MTNDIGNLSQSQLERGLLNFSAPTQTRNAWFTEEPDLKEEIAQIWKSQVLIPHSNSL